MHRAAVYILADGAIKARHELIIKAIVRACAKLNIVARESGKKTQAAGSNRCPFDVELSVDGKALALDITVPTPFEPVDSVDSQNNAIISNIDNTGKAEEARQNRQFKNTAAHKEHEKRTLPTDVPPTMMADGRHAIWVTNSKGHRVCSNCLTAPELARQQSKSFSTITIESCLVLGKDAWGFVDTLTEIAEELQEVIPQHFKEGFLREIGVAMAKGNAQCVQDAMAKGNPKHVPVDWHGQNANQFDVQTDGWMFGNTDG